MKRQSRRVGWAMIVSPSHLSYRWTQLHNALSLNGLGCQSFCVLLLFFEELSWQLYGQCEWWQSNWVACRELTVIQSNSNPTHKGENFQTILCSEDVLSCERTFPSHQKLNASGNITRQMIEAWPHRARCSSASRFCFVFCSPRECPAFEHWYDHKDKDTFYLAIWMKNMDVLCCQEGAKYGKRHFPTCGHKQPLSSMISTTHYAIPVVVGSQFRTKTDRKSCCWCGEKIN